MSAEIINVDIEPIELCKLLKIANLVGGGGEAKIVISEGYVLVNNEPEFQKRKKIYDGDVVEFNGELIQVSVDQDAMQAKMALQKKKPINKSNPTKAKKVKTTTSALKLTKRKPLNF